MDREKFIKTCGWGCLGMFGIIPLLKSCTPVKYLQGTINGNFLEIPVSAFEYMLKKEVRFRTYVVAYNSVLQYPICLYRLSSTEYKALLMKCTHQGTELQVFGDRLQCSAHGSEFTKNGVVQNGPAKADLREFPVHIETGLLKIDLI